MRIEIGPKDMNDSRVSVCMRDNREKSEIKVDLNLESNLNTLFEQQYDRIYSTAKQRFRNSICKATTWADFMK